MTKFIKKYKILIYISSFFLCIALVVLIVLTKKFHDKVVHFITTEISDKIKSKVVISDIRTFMFSKVILEELYVEDMSGDTIFYLDEVRARLSIDWNTKSIIIKKIVLYNPLIDFKIDSTKTINLKFIIDALTSNEKKKKKKWNVEFSNCVIKNGCFRLYNDDNIIPEYGINFGNFELNNLNTEVSNLAFSGDTVTMDIKNLSFIEKSGFKTNHLSTQFFLCKQSFHFSNVVIETDRSKIKVTDLNMGFSDFKDFKTPTVFEKIKWEGFFMSSQMSFADIAFFAPKLKNIKTECTVSGYAYGSLNNLKCRKIRLKYGEATSIYTSVNIQGLPDFKSSFLYVDMKSLLTNIHDINSFVKDFALKNIRLDKTINNFGSIHYRGQFTGYLDDFVAYGSLKTALGYISTDIWVKPSGTESIALKGKVSTSGFDLSNFFVKKDIFGEVTLNANIDGKIIPGKSFNAKINTSISNCVFKNYEYKNISAEGKLTNNMFDGNITVNDPNLDLEFKGMVNFSESTKQFKFNSSVKHAGLYNLNIYKNDSLAAASFNVTVNGNFKNKNDFKGEVLLSNISLKRSKLNIKTGKINLNISNNADSSSCFLNSDIADISIKGKYLIFELPRSIKEYIYKFTPAFSSGDTISNDSSIAYINAHIKNANELCKYTGLDICFSNNTYLNGLLIPSERKFEFHLTSPDISQGNNVYYDVAVSAIDSNNIITVKGNSKSALINKKIELSDINASGSINNNQIDVNTTWFNTGYESYKNYLGAIISFNILPEREKPITEINLKPSLISIKDKKWDISPSSILIDTSAIEFNDVVISGNGQKLLLDGKISQRKDTVLNLILRNFDIETINLFTKNNKFYFDGVMNGSIVVSDFYNKKIFTANLIVDTLFVNNEPLGETHITGTYNNKNKQVSIEGYSMRGKIKTLSALGYYIPSTKELNLDFDINKLKLNTFSPVFAGIFSNIQGLADGKLLLNGIGKDLVLNGNIDIMVKGATIDYLKTRYSFTDNISIKNNIVIFNKTEVYDQYGNTALLNGTIKNNYFRDFYLDLSLDTRRFLFLDTGEEDNIDYYGTCFGSGTIKIAGNPSNLFFNIKAKSEKGTEFSIPIYSGEEAANYEFITFKKPLDTAKKTVKTPKPEPITTTMQMNFDLELTPDAEVQIVFYSKIGDIIKGKGYGNIKMDINTLGKYNMYGDYTISSGDYLFTLQNIINRRFTIEPGGTITWNGDPLNADINIKAIYPLKVSLEGIFNQKPASTEEDNNSTPNNKYRKRIPVECQVLITDKLLLPQIEYRIYLPNADPETKSKLEGFLNSQEELNNQFISLLVINSFMIQNPDYYQGGYANSTEFISNQLSNYLSKVNKDIDVGLNMRPKSDYTSEEIEVAVSYRFLNDRVQVTGNLDYGGNTIVANPDLSQKQTNLFGDIDVDVKISENNKLRFKAFNRANNNVTYETSEYTQGMGIFYRDDFDSFGELMSGYWNKMFKKNKKTQ